MFWNSQKWVGKLSQQLILTAFQNDKVAESETLEECDPPAEDLTEALL